MAKHTITAEDLVEHEGDLKYVGPLEPAKEFLLENYNVNVATQKSTKLVSVFIREKDGRTEELDCYNCDAWGVDYTEEEAWRYAIGEVFGPVDEKFTPFELG